jgi:L-threonylcarbamoyladenylate synthase
MGVIREYAGKAPRLGARVYLAETAAVIGDVVLGDDASVWYNSVVRGDCHFIRIGDRTNVQDNCAVHVTEEYPTILGRGCARAREALRPPSGARGRPSRAGLRARRTAVERRSLALRVGERFPVGALVHEGVAPRGLSRDPERFGHREGGDERRQGRHDSDDVCRRVRLSDLLVSSQELASLRALLARGGVAALPTETFYALAADPTSESGVSRLFEIKGRDDEKPLLVLFSSRAQLEALGVAARPDLLDRLFRLWPAPLTVVLPLGAPIAASRGSATLGVRMPAHPTLRELLDAIGPLTGTSANRSGTPPLADPDAVARELPDLDLLVDGGTTPGGAPSTIVDATVEPPRVLRAGAFRWPEAR